MSIRRAIVGVALLTACVVAEAATLEPVPAPSRQCAQAAEEYGAYCEEWRFTGNPRYRLLAFGYEDGVSYVFQKRTIFGHYRQWLRVDPVLQPAGDAGQQVSGYLGKLEDIVDGGGNLTVLASFEQAPVREGEILEGELETPNGQVRVPAVLFVGQPPGGHQQVAPMHFQRITLRDLRRRSRRATDVPE
jgi:hypothetical protein